MLSKNKIINFSLDSTLKNSFELKESEKDPFIQLIKEYSEIEKICEAKKMGFLYIHRKKVQNLLYDLDKIININSNDNFNFSDIFYLILLINEDNNFATYEYSFDFINKLESIFQEDNSKNALIKSKIIYDLTKNIDLNKYNNNLYKIKAKFKDSFGIIEGLNVYDNETVNVNILFDKKKVDEIYGDILDALIKTNKISDYEFSYNIIQKLDLENIYITETIFNALYKTFNNKDSVKNYVINFIKDDINNKIIDDLNNNESKINFYYILFKYILKNPIYIYQIPFLNNARKKILENKTFLSIRKENSNIFKKLEYIYSFFCGTKYYIEKLVKKKYRLENRSKSKSNDSRYTQTSRQSVSTFYNEDEFSYQIMKFQKIFKNSDNKLNFNSMAFMKQMNNGYIVTGGDEDSITIIKENLEEIITISYSKNFDGELSSEEEKEIKKFKKTVNVSEIINFSDSDKIGIIDCSKYALLVYKLNLNTGKIKLERKKDISCKECFGINKIRGDTSEIEYIAVGEKGLIYFNHEFNEKIRVESNKSFIEGIKITDNIIALTSNSILPLGEDKLVFYNIEQRKEEKQTIKGSFVNNTNGLSLVEIKANEAKETNETKEYKILICACKSYIQRQRNGIFLVNPSLENNEEFSYKFYCTEKFEVNCICLINQSEYKNNTFFFFAGGVDTDRSLAMIKLFKAIYDQENNKFNITFLQDIEIEKNAEFQGFETAIVCMMQSKTNGCILVGTSDGKVYVFSEPDLKYYIEDYEEKILLHLFNKKMD